MLRDLQLRKGGKLFVQDWDNELDDFTEYEIIDEEFAFSLYGSICLEKGITLKDIFILIRRHLETCIQAIGCPFLDELVEDAFQQAPHINENREGMAAIKIGWNVFIDEDSEGEFITENITFHGIGDQDYALEFAHIHELMMYPIILDEQYNIYKDQEETPILSTYRQFTLLDILRGTVDELSYMGPPDIKDFAIEEIAKNMEDSEGVLTMDEVRKRFEEKLEENKKPCKLCGEESRAPSFGKPEGMCYACYKKLKEN